MDFKDLIQNISERIEKQRALLATEEATKNALVMPFISALGYEVFDPQEVVPEYTCDTGTKKGEKIDYAIMKDGLPIILIECKHCTENVDKHANQLFRYFTTSNARFGVLTNGIRYRFYTDLDKANVMDTKPFLDVDLSDITEAQIEELKKFHKSYFSESNIISTASQLKKETAIREVVRSEFSNPSSEFVRFFVKETNENKSSQKLIDEYTPIVKKAISIHINEVITDRLNTVVDNQGHKPEPLIEEAPDSNGVITTQEELDAYNIVKSILRKDVEVSRITYRDFKSYFVVNLDESGWYWVCRISLGTRKKQICIPKDNYKNNEWIEIQSIDDIYKYSDRLIEVLHSIIDKKHE